MYAETCLLIDGDASNTGLAALNEVRDRVKMPPLTALTPAAIKHERTVELATEGHQYNDIIRWSFDSAWTFDLNNLFKDRFISPRNLYFPIPQKDIDDNKGALSQNPGW
jgi:hypothetical protein